MAIITNAKTGETIEVADDDVYLGNRQGAIGGEAAKTVATFLGSGYGIVELSIEVGTQRVDHCRILGTQGPDFRLAFRWPGE